MALRVELICLSVWTLSERVLEGCWGSSLQAVVRCPGVSPRGWRTANSGVTILMFVMTNFDLLLNKMKYNSINNCYFLVKFVVFC